MMTNFNHYTIHEIKGLLKGEFVRKTQEELTISSIDIDSRNVSHGENTLFFAIKTNRNDGHKYIEELYKKNVKNFVVSSTDNIINKDFNANFILVKDTLRALQSLCTYHRKRFDLPVVAITGSNGKTIVKEWIFQLLSPYKNIVRSPKSFNSQIGVPLSVWQISDKNELGIFEAGISEPNEMEFLKNIILPKYGIFTNIGHAHDENFINVKHKIAEKLKLFTKVETLIYCTDHSDIQEVIIKSEILKSVKAFTWSYKQNANLKINSVLKKEKQTQIKALYNNNLIEIHIPFNDDASIENAIHCWCLMLLLGYAQDVIEKRMSKLSSVAMRLELKEGINNCTIINDTYNSDINSLIIALDFLNQQNQHPKKTLILSDILQSGKSDNELYEEVALLVNEKKINKIIGIGKAISKQANKFNTEKLFYKSTLDFFKNFSFSDLNNETILLKGARDFEFEKIAAYIQQKTHKTTLEVNLNAIVNNLNYYKSILAPDVKLMAMVKAFSYGTGSYEIANLLQFNKVDYLGVAFSDEGKELRKAGIILPILVMSPDESGFDDMVKYNLEPEIYSLRMLELFEQTLLNNNFDGLFKVHIKIDTGMHRLGFEEFEIDGLIRKLKNSTKLKVQSVFSHLASSSNEIHDAFTQQQIRTYESVCDTLKKELGYNFMRHILNTGGIYRFKDKQYDMVRLGLGLYGIANVANEQEFLQNVSTLRSSISQIKNIKKGDTIGYERSFTAKFDMQTATVPIGYADGLSRRLGNGIGKMKVQNSYVPIIGHVCMDMCMIDITGINAKEGDEVIIFDKNYSVVDFAKDMDTIPYEVLTSFSRRVKRIYFQE